MQNQKINFRFAVVAALILLAAFSRIIPHMPNFSPLGAIGLFGAAYFTKKWQAFLIPIGATWLSDLFINNVIYAQYYPTFTWFSEGFYWMYGSYLLITLAGLFIFKKITVQRVLAGALTSTVIFFLITNFACFPSNPTYPQNFNGLVTCYAVGIPFLKGTLLGDLFYSVVLFGAFALAEKKFSVLKINHV
jgi:uncharacterized protein DUF6580